MVNIKEVRSRRIVIFTPEEVRRETARLMQECKIELLRQGKIGKRSTRANREALYACVKSKWTEKVRSAISGLTPPA